MSISRAVIYCLVLFVFFKDLDSHIVNCGVVENHDSSIGSRLDVHSGVFPEFIVASAEIVAYGLNGYIELIGNLMGGSVGKTVFNTAEFIECDSFSHNSRY